MLACFKLRAVPINVNYRYVAAELAPVVADAGVVGIVCDERPSPRGALPPARDVGAPDRRCLRGVGRGGRRHRRVRRALTRRPLRALHRRDDRHASRCRVAARGHLLLRARLGEPRRPAGRSSRGHPAACADEPCAAHCTVPPEGDPGPDAFVALSLGPCARGAGSGWRSARCSVAMSVLYDDIHTDMAAVLDLSEQAESGDAQPGRRRCRHAARRAARRPPGRCILTVAVVRLRRLDLVGAQPHAAVRPLPSVLAITEAVGSSEAPVQAVATARRDGPPIASMEFYQPAPA